MPTLQKLRRTLSSYEKENLSEILHLLATGLKGIYNCDSVRIYLEDLYEGMLICNYVTGQNLPDQHRITKYISPKESITSKAFYENQKYRRFSHHLPDAAHRHLES